jgi:uncharacterized protein
MRKLLVLLSLILAWTAPAAAQEIPDRARRAVVDEANVIADGQERLLNQRIVDWNRATGHQLVVATIPSLQGADIADYANTLLRTWGLGRAGANDGVILLLAPAERQVRIEVGYGLEPVLTDALSSQIIEETIRPGLRSGDVAAALSAGADRIMTTATMDPADATALTLAAERAPRKRGFPWLWVILGTPVAGFLILMIYWWPWFTFPPFVALFPGPTGRARQRRDDERAREERRMKELYEREEASLRRKWERQKAKGTTPHTTFRAYKAAHDLKERQKWEAQKRASGQGQAGSSSSGSSSWSSSGDSGWDSGSSSSDSGFDSGGGSGGGGGSDSSY